MKFEDFVGVTWPFNRSIRLRKYAKLETTCFGHTFMIVYDKNYELEKELAKKVVGDWARNSEFPYRYFTYTHASIFCQMIDDENRNMKQAYYNPFITTNL
jgi:hypothetical protein